MPIPSENYIGETKISVALEPVQSMFYSLSLLNQETYRPSYSEWVTRVRSAMSLEERQRHRLVTVGFCYALYPPAGWQSYLNYVDQLASTPPADLQDKLLSAYAHCRFGERMWEWNESRVHFDKRQALGSFDNYLEFLGQHFAPDHIDPELEAQAYSYVTNPPAMKELIIQHLRWIWEAHLSSEWGRVRPMLSQAVRAFDRLDYSGMDRLEAARLITGQQIQDPSWIDVLQAAQQVIFIPNAHVGPYLGRIISGQTLGVIFGARLPEGAEQDIPELSRADILVRLGTLADDTRLRILRYVAESGEVRAQDIILSMEISQPAASRHLTQLTATGFLLEQRVNGSKSYKLNPQRIQDTMQAVSNFLVSKEGLEEQPRPPRIPVR
jgi:DNA-binding transcriptional ArsR family regulator